MNTNSPLRYVADTRVLLQYPETMGADYMGALELGHPLNLALLSV
jgi:hypothetical protein